MTTSEKILISSIMIIYFVFGEYLNNVIAYNTLLTYTVRYHKVKFYPNVTGNYTINQDKEHQYLNGYISINFKEPINKVILVFNRCNPEGINCEYFQTWKFTNICSLLKERNQIWSSIIESLYPRPKCPIQKEYRLQNGSVNIDPIIRLYSEATEHQWKTTIKAYSDDIYLGGASGEISIFGYRKRIKMQLKL